MVCGLTVFTLYWVTPLVHGIVVCLRNRAKVKKGVLKTPHIPPPPKNLPNISLTSKERARPDVAWFTVALGMASFLGWCVGLFLLAFTDTPRMRVMFSSTVFAFIGFTPLHDAVHGSVSPKLPALNNFVGRLTGLPLFAPFLLFKSIHLQHHQHTNEDGDRGDGTPLDPDRWAGEGARWQLPLRWATVFHHYFSCYLTQALTLPKPLATAEVLLTLVAQIITGTLLTTNNHEDVVLFGWIFPMMLSSTFLMCIFDYIPHRPHKTAQRTQRYKATVVTTLFHESTLTVPMLCQNYHNIHHLFPFVPFYKYPGIWNNHRHALIRAGTPVVPLFASVQND